MYPRDCVNQGIRGGTATRLSTHVCGLPDLFISWEEFPCNSGALIYYPWPFRSARKSFVFGL